MGMLLATSSCKKDDDTSNTCVQSDWVGTYTGTVNCDGQTDDATVTITADGADAIIIQYVAGSTTTTFDAVTPDGCNIDRTISDGGITGTLQATLDGDNLSLTESIVGGGFDSNCSLSATRM